MKRRRNTDQVNGANLNGAGSSSSSGTASQLGSAMDELMRHQPSLRVEAMNSIIKLLNQLIEMGRNPNYICQRQSSSSSSSSKSSSSMSRQQTTVNLVANSSVPPAAASATPPATTSQTQAVSAENTAVSNPVAENTAQTPSSDDETNMDEYENAIMMVDNEAQASASTSSGLGNAKKLIHLLLDFQC